MALSLWPPGIRAGLTKSMRDRGLGQQKELCSKISLVVVLHTVHTYTHHDPVQPDTTSVTTFGAAYFPSHSICCPFLAGDSGSGHGHSQPLHKLSPRKGCGQHCHDKPLSPKHKHKKGTPVIPIYRAVLHPGLTGNTPGYQVLHSSSLVCV